MEPSIRKQLKNPYNRPWLEEHIAAAQPTRKTTSLKGIVAGKVFYYLY